MVKLTFREHYICHKLLCKIYPNERKVIYAFSSMIRVSWKNTERLKYLTSRHFEEVKTKIAPYMGKWNIGRPAWNKGLKGDSFKKRYKNGGLKPPTMLGWKWINNGSVNKKISPGVCIPLGWIRGRIFHNNPMKNKEIAKKCVESRRRNEKL